MLNIVYCCRPWWAPWLPTSPPRTVSASSRAFWWVGCGYTSTSTVPPVSLSLAWRPVSRCRGCRSMRGWPARILGVHRYAPLAWLLWCFPWGRQTFHGCFNSRLYFNSRLIQFSISNQITKNVFKPKILFGYLVLQKHRFNFSNELYIYIISCTCIWGSPLTGAHFGFTA